MPFYLKFLQSGGHAPFVRKFIYGVSCLPTDDGEPGQWLPRVSLPVLLCERGYHASPRHEMRQWTQQHLYVVELDGMIEHGGEKVVGERIRFVKRVKEWEDAEFPRRVIHALLTHAVNHPNTKVRSKKVIELAHAALAVSFDDTEERARRIDQANAIVVADYSKSALLFSITQSLLVSTPYWYDMFLAMDYTAELIIGPDEYLLPTVRTLMDEILFPALGIDPKEIQ